jgi:hypothetical protein
LEDSSVCFIANTLESSSAPQTHPEITVYGQYGSVRMASESDSSHPSISASDGPPRLAMEDPPLGTRIPTDATPGQKVRACLCVNGVFLSLTSLVLIVDAILMVVTLIVGANKDGAFVGSDCSCHVHLGSLHSNLTMINMQLYTLQVSGNSMLGPSPATLVAVGGSNYNLVVNKGDTWRRKSCGMRHDCVSVDVCSCFQL